MKLFLSKYAPARHLEAALGDPYEDGLFSYAQRVAEDEEERYPVDALHRLDAWGMQQYYVPAHWGGALRDFETLFALVRTISRRDLTVAVSHAVSFLGSAGVWIAGSQDLQRMLAARLLQGERISLALTEREHGGDLLSCETKADPGEDQLRILQGEKWLINGATRNPLLSVLARTSPNGGSRGFSLFLFDKHAAQPETFACLDKVHTLGVRGGDISGIRFQDAAVKAAAMIGDAGQGFETVIKGLYLSRLLCGAMSLGAAETAFQMTLDFALSRRLYGGTVFDIPHCRRLLVESWVDLLLCESMITAAARSLHFVPSEASVHSAVVKYLVPHILEHTFKQLSIVLGARHYLREGLHFGIFQKMLRDNSLVSLFDGSSVVNLYSLTTQFKALSRSWTKSQHRPADGFALHMCDLAAPLPEFSWHKLALVGGGENCFIDSLRSSLNAVRGLAGSACLPDNVAALLPQQADALENAAHKLMAEVDSVNFGAPHRVTSEAFDRAADYCTLEAAAMTLQTYLANRAYTEADRSGGQWLVLALARLNTMLGQKPRLSDDLMKDLGEQLLKNQTEKPGFRPREFSPLCRPAPETFLELQSS
jgi:alkylation response protein AidB-like acyl-CoA dehydrogenase